MKQTLKRRICAAILCHILLFGLAGCGKANKAKLNDGGDPPVKASVDALKQGQPAADSEETVDGAESLARVRGDLEYDGRLTGAAAYLGLREKGDQTELTDWLRENCADLTSELPFLLEIPSERVLGAGYGKLFCIVPRDENTSLAVNHVTWQMMGNGLHPVTDEVLYREEYAEPVLVFVDPEEPDKEVNLVTNDGVAALWYPQEDGYGNLILPTDEDGAPMLYDFAIYGYTTGLDYPEGWEPSGDDWWLPPTELGLADTSWLCDSWVLELRGGDAGPGYAGTADLYYAPVGRLRAGLLRRVAHGGRLPVSEALRRQRRRNRRELPDPHFPLRRGSLFPALAHGRGDPLPAGRHGLRRAGAVHRVRRRARRPRDAAPGVRDKLTAAREETKKASEKGHSLPFSDAFCMAAALHRAKAPTGAVVRSACFCGGLRGGRCAARSLSPDRCAQGYPCAYK